MKQCWIKFSLSFLLRIIVLPFQKENKVVCVWIRHNVSQVVPRCVYVRKFDNLPQIIVGKIVLLVSVMVGMLNEFIIIFL